jgi:hypothetical protein
VHSLSVGGTDYFAISPALPLARRRSFGDRHYRYARSSQREIDDFGAAGTPEGGPYDYFRIPCTPHHRHIDCSWASPCTCADSS